MKVGVFTFHYAYNYGAVLQCLALYRTLRGLGVDADVVRYIPGDFRSYPPLWRGWGIKKGLLFENIPKKWIAARRGPEMEKRFDDFREEYFTFSPLCSSPAEIADAVSGYDALITGSDQVWHFAQKPPFFLEWGVPYHGKRISYAPCCGHKEQPQERVGQIKEWLSRFGHISVRNDFSQKIIEQVVGKPVPVVADPTLLTDLSDVQQEVELPCADYILMYTLGDEIKGGHAQIIQSIRKKVGDLPVVAVVPSAHKPHLAPWADHVIYTAGPGEWLYLIAHAKFVYSDSYHGALFAMKYQKPFLAYYTEAGRAPRLLDLAWRYAVESSVAGDADEAVKKKFWNAPDYQKTQALMSSHAEQSRIYLERALND